MRGRKRERVSEEFGGNWAALLLSLAGSKRREKEEFFEVR